MSTSSVLYFIGGPGPARDLCLAVRDDARFFDTVADFITADDKVPGLVVLDPQGTAEALTLAGALQEASADWTLALADAAEPPTLRTVSLGPPAGPEALARHLEGEAGRKVALVDLHEALVQMARVRHDVNNPLTAGMAEIQILLMDNEDDAETREALLVVQEQLRRIRDLLAATRHLRSSQG